MVHITDRYEHNNFIYYVQSSFHSLNTGVKVLAMIVNMRNSMVASYNDEEIIISIFKK